MEKLKVAFGFAMGTILAFAVAGIAVAVIFNVWAAHTKALDTPSVQGQHNYITAASTASQSPGVDSATTTTTWMPPTTTASSTITGSMQGGTKIAMEIHMTASSSAAILALSIDGSDNQVDWYPIDFLTLNATNEGALNGANGNTWTWTPVVTTRALKSVMFEGITTKYYRVNIGSVAATSTVWATAFPIVPIPGVVQ